MKDLDTNFFRVSRDPALTEAYAELQKLAQRWQARNRARRVAQQSELLARLASARSTRLYGGKL